MRLDLANGRAEIHWAKIFQCPIRFEIMSGLDLHRLDRPKLGLTYWAGLILPLTHAINSLVHILLNVNKKNHNVLTLLNTTFIPLY